MRGLRVALLSLLALLAAAAPAGAAEWQRASLITPPFSQVFEVRTEVTEAGETLVLWEDSNTLVFRTRQRGQDAGAPEQVATGVARTWTMDADSQGNAVVAWVVSNNGADNAILARFRPAGGQFGPVQVVSAEEIQASQLQVALAPTGEAVVAWRFLGLGAGQRRVRTASRAPGAEGFGPVSTLAQGEPLLRGVGIDSMGNAMVAWSDDGLRVARRRAGGEFADPEVLSTAGQELKGEAVLAVDPTGYTVLAFTEGPADNRSSSAHVVVATGDTAFGFDRSRIVSGPFARDLAVDTLGGWGAVAWRAASGRNSRVQAVHTEGEFISPTQSLSLRNARRPDIVVAAEGRVTAAWQRLTERGRTIEATSRPAVAERFPEEAERISPYGDVSGPILETNVRGEQFAAWIRSGRGLSRAESAKASSRTGRFIRVLTVFDGRIRVGENVVGVRLEPAGNVMQAVYVRMISRTDRRFWDLSTYGE